MKHWSRPSTSSNSNRLRGLRPSLRTNILLRCHRYYQSTLRYPLRRQHPSPMNLRRLLSRQRNPHPLLRIPLPTTIHHCSCYHAPPALPTRNGIKQPPRPKLRRRQNLFPPLLLIQRPIRLRSRTHCINLSGTILS